MFSEHSREQAAALGLMRYFTGKPCRHGHIAEPGDCLECSHARVTEWNAANRKHVREMKRKRRAANLEREREREREYARGLRAAEGWKERHRRWRAAWDAKNKDKVAAQRAVYCGPVLRHPAELMLPAVGLGGRVWLGSKPCKGGPAAPAFGGWRP
jgi:hypothetical protein